MDEEHRKRILDLIGNPPPGSKLAEAKDFGVDLTLLVERLELSPTQRLEALESAQQFLEELREAAIRTR